MDRGIGNQYNSGKGRLLSPAKRGLGGGGFSDLQAGSFAAALLEAVAVAVHLQDIHDALAHPEARDGGTNSIDNPGCLMAHDHGREAASCTTVIAMHVTPADSASPDTNEQILTAAYRFLGIDIVKGTSAQVRDFVAATGLQMIFCL